MPASNLCPCGASLPSQCTTRSSSRSLSFRPSRSPSVVHTLGSDDTPPHMVVSRWQKSTCSSAFPFENILQAFAVNPLLSTLIGPVQPDEYSLGVLREVVSHFHLFAQRQIILVQSEGVASSFPRQSLWLLTADVKHKLELVENLSSSLCPGPFRSQLQKSECLSSCCLSEQQIAGRCPSTVQLLGTQANAVISLRCSPRSHQVFRRRSKACERARSRCFSWANMERRLAKRLTRWWTLRPNRPLRHGRLEVKERVYAELSTTSTTSSSTCITCASWLCWLAVDVDRTWHLIQARKTSGLLFFFFARYAFSDHGHIIYTWTL